MRGFAQEVLMEKTNQKGKWNRLMGKAKGLVSKLTEKDLDRMAGKFEILVRELQDRYGYSRRQAVQVISQRVIDYRTEVRKKRSPSRYD
jgi:uncharacterized protein YjbJ (UPF0337 family)